MSRTTQDAKGSPAIDDPEDGGGGGHRYIRRAEPIPPLVVCCRATIGDQLQTYRSALNEAQANGVQAIARKIEQQIRKLEAFQQRHQEETEAPSPFEVFCDLNSSDITCRVYDD
jgi:hypothetical protein